MKRMRGLCWLPLVLKAVLGCGAESGASSPAGGHSGDDGSGAGDAMIPPSACRAVETTLDARTTTVFGASAAELLEGLSVGGSAPLYWVPFDGVPNTSLSPGPSQSAIALGVERIASESVVERVTRPVDGQASCPTPELHVPVLLTLASVDGALDARVSTTLTFTSAKTARLSAEIAPDQLGGSFSVEHIGPDDEVWELRAMNVYATLWPGGSSGALTPALVRTDEVAPPWNAWGEAADPPYGSSPYVPDHYNDVAVWPRREICSDGTGRSAADAADALNGWSPIDLVNELSALSPLSLLVGEDRVNVAVELETPSGLLCASSGGPMIDMDVAATLRAESAPVGSTLEHFAASTVLHITGRAALDGTAIEELTWSRRDVVDGAGRAAFEAQNGIALDAPGDYQDIWWSWHGRATRAGDAWSVQGALLVSALDADDAARIEQQVAAGGPGASVSVDARGFPTLPGDLLLDAELAVPTP